MPTKKTQQELLKEWDNLTLANGFIFYKVFRNNPDACKKLIEILLNIEVEKLEIISEEETISIDKEAKAIRLDLYVKNETHMFDIELQINNTGELPERARYYQSVMDVDSLNHSQLYSELKTSHVIFICMSDIFHKGLPVYTFQNSCNQDDSIKLNDRTFKHFFIATNCDKITQDEELKAFLNLLITNNSSTAFTNDLRSYVEVVKHNTLWQEQYMTVERFHKYAILEGVEQGLQQGREIGMQQGREIGMQQGREIGMQEGREIGMQQGREIGLQEGRIEGLQEGRIEGSQQKALETAKKMKSDNMSVELIEKYTGLSKEQIQAL